MLTANDLLHQKCAQVHRSTTCQVPCHFFGKEVSIFWFKSSLFFNNDSSTTVSTPIKMVVVIVKIAELDLAEL